MNIDKKFWDELVTAQENLIEECAGAYERMDAPKCECKQLGLLASNLFSIMEKIENNKNIGDGSYEDNIAFSPKINRD